MQTQTRFWSRLGALGIAYAVLMVIAQVLIGNTPGTSASGATVLAFYRGHKASEMAAVFVLAAAVLAFSFFLGSLRNTLSRNDEGRQLANVVTAGGAIYVVGLLMMGALSVALVDAGHYKLAGAAQALNVLSSDLWVPVVVGLSVLSLGTGVSALRNSGLPRWLGWASIVLGILAVAGPVGAIAFLLAPVWTLVVGIAILRSPSSDQGRVEHAAVAYSSVNG
jgi:hypothetical protein